MTKWQKFSNKTKGNSKTKKETLILTELDSGGKVVIECCGA